MIRRLVSLGLLLVVSLTFVRCGQSRSAPAEAASDGLRPVAALPPVPTEEFYQSADVRTILAGAHRLMRADSNAALITVDSSGQPRARSVRAFLEIPDEAHPERGLTVWIMTRLATRKVDQVRGHPQVTLYFNDDADISYATVMGIGIVHTDPEHPDVRRPYNADLVRMVWPDFPRDFVMLEVRARWLEYMGDGADNHPETWRPQAVSFER